MNHTLSADPNASITEEYEISGAGSEQQVSRASSTGEENYLDGGYGWVVTGGERLLCTDKADGQVLLLSCSCSSESFMHGEYSKPN